MKQNTEICRYYFESSVGMRITSKQRCEHSSSVCQQSSLNSQSVADSRCIQSTVPTHQPVMTKECWCATPTAPETDCAAVGTSAPWPSVVPHSREPCRIRVYLVYLCQTKKS